jgi:transposase InsO family protein
VLTFAAPPAPTLPSARWSMDFVRDAMADGRAFRGSTVVDDLAREARPARSIRIAHVSA